MCSLCGDLDLLDAYSTAVAVFFILCTDLCVCVRVCVRPCVCPCLAEEDSDETKAWVESQTKASALINQNGHLRTPPFGLFAMNSVLLSVHNLRFTSVHAQAAYATAAKRALHCFTAVYVSTTQRYPMTVLVWIDRGKAVL